MRRAGRRLLALPAATLLLSSLSGAAVGTVTVTVLRAPSGCIAGGVTAAQDGNVWAAGAGPNPRLARVTPAGKFTIFPASGANIFEITSTRGPAGRLWYFLRAAPAGLSDDIHGAPPKF